VTDPATRAPQILDEAVAVRIAGPGDPGERAACRLLELERERPIPRPAPELRKQDQEQRGRVDRAVVPVGPGARGLAATHFVDDLAGLRVALWIVLVCLSRGELEQCARRKLGAEDERLQARDQRVPAEDGHEPRGAGGRERTDMEVVVFDPQRREIGERAVPRAGQVVP